ncbi:hypothetical protein [Rhizobium leguminosarum]
MLHEDIVDRHVGDGDANPPEDGLPLRGRKFEEGRVIEIMLRQCLE